MFNKFKQDCSDIKAIASRKIRLTVHFDVYGRAHRYIWSCPNLDAGKSQLNVTADEVLAHWRNISDIKMYFVFFAWKTKYKYINVYFKYKMQNTNTYFKYVFQILVFEILPSIERVV